LDIEAWLSIEEGDPAIPADGRGRIGTESEVAAWGLSGAKAPKRPRGRRFCCPSVVATPPEPSFASVVGDGEAAAVVGVEAGPRRAELLDAGDREDLEPRSVAAATKLPRGERGLGEASSSVGGAAVTGVAFVATVVATASAVGAVAVVFAVAASAVSGAVVCAASVFGCSISALFGGSTSVDVEAGAGPTASTVVAAGARAGAGNTVVVVAARGVSAAAGGGATATADAGRAATGASAGGFAAGVDVGLEAAFAAAAFVVAVVAVAAFGFAAVVVVFVVAGAFAGSSEAAFGFALGFEVRAVSSVLTLGSLRLSHSEMHGREGSPGMIKTRSSFVVTTAELTLNFTSIAFGPRPMDSSSPSTVASRLQA